MAQIAIAAGVPQDDVSVEAQSRDTIGNVWFTKPLLHQHGWHRVIVVTSGWHAPRVHYLTQVIWGPSYMVAIEPVRGEQRTRQAEEIAVWEAGLLAVSRRWFARISPVTTLRSVPSWPGSTPSTLTSHRQHWPS